MKILLIEEKGMRTTRRMIEEGRKLGHQVDAASMRDLRFIVRRGTRSVRLGTKNVLEDYDALALRHFYPFISEALLLAEAAASAGLRVVDRAMAEGRYVQSKMYEYSRLASAGLPVPEGFQVMRLAEAKKELSGRHWPLVAKGVHGARGRYVFKLDHEEEALAQLSDDLVGSFTFQEYLPIEEEYRVLVVDGRAIGAMRKYAADGDFRHNVSVGAEGEFAVLPKALLSVCERASTILEREFAGVDLAIAGGKPYILEVNRRPGFIGFEEATGINAAKAFIAHVAQDRNRRPAERRQVHALPSHHQKAGRLRQLPVLHHRAERRSGGRP